VAGVGFEVCPQKTKRFQQVNVAANGAGITLQANRQLRYRDWPVLGHGKQARSLDRHQAPHLVCMLKAHNELGRNRLTTIELAGTFACTGEERLYPVIVTLN